MQLTPRYGDEPVMRAESVIDDPATPTLRQRARLATLLAGLDDEQWAAPSRCEGWSVQDVVAHLTTTNQFWAFSITAGLQGEPTRLLSTFDPVASPAEMVEAVRSRSSAEALAGFTASNEQLAAVLAAVDDGWSAVAEAPPGHIAISLVVLHALWDSWIHERDITVPLGLAVTEEPDEVAGALVYAAALGPAFLAAGGSTRRGALAVRASDPELDFVVEIGAHVLVHGGPAPADAVTIVGDAVELIEGLSFRAPFTPMMAEGDRWLLGGLGEVFDQAG